MKPPLLPVPPTTTVRTWPGTTVREPETLAPLPPGPPAPPAVLPPAAPLAPASETPTEVIPAGVVNVAPAL